MSTDPYRLEPIDPTSFSALVPLMKDAFGHNVDTGYFDWKYLDNPAGPAIGHVAIDTASGDIAAFYGMIPEHYRWGDHEAIIYQSCDTMTHSDHRRRGLFQRLAKATFAKAEALNPAFFAYGFGGPTSTPGFVKMGWDIEIDLRFLFRPRLLTQMSGFLGQSETLRIATTPDAPLLELMKANETRREQSKVFDGAFLLWRLAQPRRAYTYVVDPGEAYAIYYQADGHIFLFDFWEMSNGSGTAVLRHVDRAASEPGSKGVLTFAQTTGTFARSLRRHGYLSNPFKRGPATARIPFITYGPAGIPGGQPGAARAWDISPIDHDSY
jgi:hypothetical protein